MFFSLWGFRLRVPQSLDRARHTLNSSGDPQETVHLSNSWEEQGDPRALWKQEIRMAPCRMRLSLDVPHKWLQNKCMSLLFPLIWGSKTKTCALRELSYVPVYKLFQGEKWKIRKQCMSRPVICLKCYKAICSITATCVWDTVFIKTNSSSIILFCGQNLFQNLPLFFKNILFLKSSSKCPHSHAVGTANMLHALKLLSNWEIC